MDTRFLESLLEVVRLGSIAEAARSLNLTPAAVGQRIKVLERDFNAVLLIRSGHKAEPTEACLHFLPQIRKIVSACKDLEFGWDPSDLSGILRVGAISTVMTSLVPSAIKGVRQSHPQLQVHLYPGSSKELYRQVIDRDLDMAIIASPPVEVDKSLTIETLRRENLVFVSSSSIDATPESALLSEPFIAYDPMSWGGLVGQRYLDRTGIKPNVISVLDSPEAIATLVADGVGVSILPDWVGLTTPERKIQLSRMKDLLDQRVVSVIQRRDSTRSSKTDLFRQILQNLTVDSESKI